MFRSGFVIVFSLTLLFLGLQAQNARAASSSIAPLSDQDYNQIESGAACWLAGKNHKNYLYDNLSRGLIRYEGKVYVLKRLTGAWDKGIYECGQSYFYESEDGQLKVDVVMMKSKKKNGPCSGNLTASLKGQSATVKNLSSDCGA
jgi:hypothetical protein